MTDVVKAPEVVAELPPPLVLSGAGWDVDPAAFPGLAISNALLDDREALDAEWERRGYWYFKGVLDREALDTFRGHILNALKPLDMVEEDGDLLRVSERAPAVFPDLMRSALPVPELLHLPYWRAFLRDPKIEATFERILGAKPAWVPVAETRAVPPGDDTGEVFGYPHQDGYYNEGYRCLTVWIPLWAAPRSAGGLAVAEGMHHQGFLHDPANGDPIPRSAIPEGTWRTSDYAPGDVVLFDRKLPHVGLRNRGEGLFRVSFDVRCNLPGDPPPVVGHVEAIDEVEIAVRTEEGALETYGLAEAKIRRRHLPPAELVRQFPVGSEVMLTVENGLVQMIRAPKY